jgi:ABC-type transport system substrate-binding protein
MTRRCLVLLVAMALGAGFGSTAWAQEEPRLTIAQGTDITSLDPAFAKIRNDDNVYLELFETLVHRNEQMQYLAVLAESWKVLSPTKWQFKLRSGITFHNGEPFDAEAVKYSIERIYDPALNAPAFLKGFVTFDRVEAHVNPTLRPYAYDPEKAKALLAEAGWKLESGTLTKDGQPFAVTFDTPSGRYIRDKDIAEAVASYLERIGVRVKLNILVWPVYSKKMFEDVAPADLYFLGLGSSFNGQSEMQYISKTYAYNPVAYNNPEYEQTYQELNATAEPAKRVQLLHRLQQIASSSAASSTPAASCSGSASSPLSCCS